MQPAPCGALRAPSSLVNVRPHGQRRIGSDESSDITNHPLAHFERFENPPRTGPSMLYGPTRIGACQTIVTRPQFRRHRRHSAHQHPRSAATAPSSMPGLTGFARSNMMLSRARLGLYQHTTSRAPSVGPRVRGRSRTLRPRQGGDSATSLLAAASGRLDPLRRLCPRGMSPRLRPRRVQPGRATAAGTYFVAPVDLYNRPRRKLPVHGQRPSTPLQPRSRPPGTRINDTPRCCSRLVMYQRNRAIKIALCRRSWFDPRPRATSSASTTNPRARDNILDYRGAHRLVPAATSPRSRTPARPWA